MQSPLKSARSLQSSATLNSAGSSVPSPLRSQPKSSSAVIPSSPEPASAGKGASSQSSEVIPVQDPAKDHDSSKSGTSGSGGGGAGSKSVFRNLRQKKGLSLSTDSDTSALKEGDESNTLDSAPQPLAPPQLALLQCKKKPVKTFKAASTLVSGTSTSSISHGRSSPSRHSHGTGTGSHHPQQDVHAEPNAHLAMMLQSTEDFVVELRRRVADVVRELPADFQPPAFTVNATNKAAPVSGRTTATPATTATDDRAQLSLYHKMLQSRQLLWDATQTLAEGQVVAQTRILQAQAESQACIQRAAQEALAAAESRLEDLITQQTAQTQRQADDGAKLAEFLSLLEEAQRDRMEDRAMKQRALRQVIATLRAQREAFHLQLRQQARSVLTTTLATRELSTLTARSSSSSMVSSQRQHHARALSPHQTQRSRPLQDSSVAQSRKAAFREASLQEHYALVEAKSEQRTRRIHQLLAQLH